MTLKQQYDLLLQAGMTKIKRLYKTAEPYGWGLDSGSECVSLPQSFVRDLITMQALRWWQKKPKNKGGYCTHDIEKEFATWRCVAYSVNDDDGGGPYDQYYPPGGTILEAVIEAVKLDRS